MSQTIASFIIVSNALLGNCATAMLQPEFAPDTFDVARVRRQALSGSLASNLAGGADARVALTKALGTPGSNLAPQGNGVELTKTHTPGVRDSFQQTATANLYNDGVHNIDAKAFASQNQLANGFKSDRNGAALDYAHINGHGASVTHSNIPGLGRQLELSTRANLWQSQDHNTRVDLISQASKWLSGPLNGKNDFGATLGLSHYFN
ncbi:hypothetical protein ACLKA7_013273 [Drosophila subpalustris]